MGTAKQSLQSRFGRVLAGQFLITLVVSVVMFFYQDKSVAASVAFGGFIAMLLSGWLATKIKRLDEKMDNRQAVNAAVLVLGFAPRLLMVLVLFWLGIGYLKLDPLAMTLMFSATYIVYWIELYRARDR